MMRDVYADESSQTNHRFLVLGGVTARTEDVPELVRLIRDARSAQLPHGEMKWTKVSGAKLPAYKAVVDAFFDMSRRDAAHFHSVIVDMAKFNNHKFNGGDREVGFSKMMFQLLAKFGRIYDERLYVYLDSRTTRQSLDDWRLMLNRYIAKRRQLTEWPYRRLVFRDSKESDVIQLNDILLGAIAWVKNGHGDRDGASSAKNELAGYVMERANLSSLDIDTLKGQNRFSVWNFRLQ